MRVEIGPFAIPDNVRRILVQGFRAADVAETLISFDEPFDSNRIEAIMSKADFDVVGTRRKGRIAGYFETGAAVREFDAANLLTESAPLLDAVETLLREPRVFVSALGQASGIVTKDDLEKPAARMWFFGMVTMIELRYARLISEICPDDTWKTHLSEGRIQKAEQLLAERSRRRRSGSLSLLDCLQLSDKGQIVARNEQIREQTIFESRSQAEAGIKLLEGLRNDLAHAQDIAAANWDAIELLVRNLRTLADGTNNICPE